MISKVTGSGSLRPCQLHALNGISCGLPVLFGLQLIEEQFVADGAAFSCCSGTGQRYDEQRRGLLLCDQQQRLRHLNQLYQWYKVTQGPMSGAVVRELTNTRQFKLGVSWPDGIKSTYYSSQYAINGLDEGWRIAFLLAWQYGCYVWLCDLSKLSEPAAPKLDDIESRLDRGATGVLVVRGISSLLQPRVADSFELIVSLAYSYRIPIVVESAKSERAGASMAQPQRTGFSTKGAFSRQLQQIKSQHPLRYVQPDCLSRLQTLCGKVEGL